MQFARVGALVGAAVAAVAATVFAAVPASAHTPKLEASCKDGTTTLSVKLTAYSQNKTNHIKVTLDDAQELENKDFKAGFEGKYSASGDVKRVFVVEVTAGDNAQYSFKETKTVEACVVPTTTTTTTTTTTVETTTEETEPTTTTTTVEVTTSESSAPATSTTTTTTAAVVPVADTGDGLANTGASIAIPLVIGVILLGGGAALLIVLRRRAANN
ncbi:hypothetical protein [Saccharothrix texasensis]|uniref:LPXTG-motif cell wall-anchored protein n=1 Tax=Saccharothrix texasensis TaxID=103734 RepID=A0A3N1HGD4_9PSEU|nr:hypothetical protein [Saccharothrix texasensis]ROP41362.1 hypothetical protein EDD40_6791 [Saccharothrix texasensis]